MLQWHSEYGHRKREHSLPFLDLGIDIIDLDLKGDGFAASEGLNEDKEYTKAT